MTRAIDRYMHIPHLIFFLSRKIDREERKDNRTVSCSFNKGFREKPNGSESCDCATFRVPDLVYILAAVVAG